MEEYTFTHADRQAYSAAALTAPSYLPLIFRAHGNCKVRKTSVSGNSPPVHRPPPLFPATPNAVYSWNACGSHKSRKKSLKTPILGFMVIQGHRWWYPRKACQQCLLWCAASLCLSATVLLLDWKIVAETARIEGGTQIWCTRTEDSLNVGGRTLHRWNIRLMRNISYAGCLGLSWMVSAQFTLIMCIASWNRKKFTKTPNFGVQGRSRSSMLVHRKCRQQCLLW